MRELEPGFGTAEWGFAIGSPFWGTGVFEEGAELMLDFAFDTLGVHRLEARAAVKNGRGNGALRKIGAVQEGVLRKSFQRNGEYLDQALYAILNDDWRVSRTARPASSVRVLTDRQVETGSRALEREPASHLFCLCRDQCDIGCPILSYVIHNDT